MKKPSTQSIGKLADAAFRQAAKDVVQRAEQTGTPVIVWEDGKIKELEPRKALKPRPKKSRTAKK